MELKAKLRAMNEMSNFTFNNNYEVLLRVFRACSSVGCCGWSCAGWKLNKLSSIVGYDMDRPLRSTSHSSVMAANRPPNVAVLCNGRRRQFLRICSLLSSRVIVSTVSDTVNLKNDDPQHFCTSSSSIMSSQIWASSLLVCPELT